MFSLRKSEPACFGCGDVTKLSKTGHCNMCTWAISQRNTLAAEHEAAELRAEALKKLDAEIEIVRARSEIAQKACKDEQKVLIDRNVKLSQDLIIAYRKLKTLEAVPVEG